MKADFNSRLFKQSGVFVYIEASSPRKTGDVARFSTVTLKPTNAKQCLTFFYHMHSVNQSMMGEFNVYSKNSKGNITLFQKSGSQVNKWQRVDVDFKATEDFQVWCTLW